MNKNSESCKSFRSSFFPNVNKDLSRLMKPCSAQNSLPRLGKPCGISYPTICILAFWGYFMQFFIGF